MPLSDIVDNFLKSSEIGFQTVTSLIEDRLRMDANNTLDIGLETIKEIAFGGAVGLCAGFAAKKAGAPVLMGVASASFLLLRGAIFDGHIQATWSPLAVDDASFAR